MHTGSVFCSAYRYNEFCRAPVGNRFLKNSVMPVGPGDQTGDFGHPSGAFSGGHPIFYIVP